MIILSLHCTFTVYVHTLLHVIYLTNCNLKNKFNARKYVGCFSLEDSDREFHLGARKRVSEEGARKRVSEECYE